MRWGLHHAGSLSRTQSSSACHLCWAPGWSQCYALSHRIAVLHKLRGRHSHPAVCFSESRHSLSAAAASSLKAQRHVFELHWEESDALLLPHFARKAPDGNVSKCPPKIAPCPGSCSVPPDVRSASYAQSVLVLKKMQCEPQKWHLL